MPIQRFFLSDFVGIQRNSFLQFLETGLIEEFSKRNPITNASKTLEVFFYPEYYQLTEPKYSTRQAILKGKSYASRLYVPVQLTDKTARVIKLKWVYIGDIPIMTKRGHFIINGAARVIVNQIIRSPGIYYQTKVYEDFSNKWAQKADNFYERYYADLICQRGTWLRLEIDKEKKIWAQTKKGPKIPIMWFLIAMGLTEKIIFKSVIDPHRLLYNMFDGQEDLTKQKAISVMGLPYLPPQGGEGFVNIFDQAPVGAYPTFDTKELKKGVGLRGGQKSRKEPFAYIKTPPEAWAEIYCLFNKKKKTTSGRKPDKRSGRNTSMAEQATIVAKPTAGLQKDKGKPRKPLKGLSIQKARTVGPYVPLGHDSVLSELGRQLIFNKFMNPRTYDLSKQGRLNFNKKFNLSISPFQTTLTPQDLLAATDYLLKVEYGLKKVDDIDNLKNRRVRTSGELIQIQFGTGLVRLEKSIREKITRYGSQQKLSKFSFVSRNKNTSLQQEAAPNVALEHAYTKNIDLASKKQTESTQKQGPEAFTHQEGFAYPFSSKLSQAPFSKKNNRQLVGRRFKIFSLAKNFKKPSSSAPWLSINSLINTKAVNSTLREFFGTSPLSQFMDQINPLAEITHKRRLSSMGPGGVTRDSATLDIRGIHPSHYGRICPVETPEGKNTGLVNSLTTYARVNAQGYIETPFYKVYKGQVQKKTGMYFFSAEQENKIKLGAADLFASDIGFLSKLNIPVRIEEEFSKITRNDVDFVGVSPTQMVSIATSLIPFLEHDDANRALMGSNMQRQAVPILKPERPIVGTGLEARAVSDSGHALQTKISGLITYVSSEKIILYNLP